MFLNRVKRSEPSDIGLKDKSKGLIDPSDSDDTTGAMATPMALALMNSLIVDSVTLSLWFWHTAC